MSVTQQAVLGVVCAFFGVLAFLTSLVARDWDRQSYLTIVASVAFVLGVVQMVIYFIKYFTGW